MKHYDAIIIGFGKGGKTLASYLGKKGQQVALVERSKEMYGGTCINVGCIPSKVLVHKAETSKQHFPNDNHMHASSYERAILEKRKLVTSLRKKNYMMLDNNPNITIYNGIGSFITNKQIQIHDGQTVTIIEGDNIFINTGSSPNIPNISGINDCNNIYTSATLMDLDVLPSNLVIIGGGYIGLEFASIYSQFGSNVTVIDQGERVASREDDDISDKIREVLEDKGIHFILESNVIKLEELNSSVTVTYQDKLSLQEHQISGNAILLALGRTPNIEELNLANAGVTVTNRKAIAVNSSRQTNIPNIWAMGDVTGDLQFTYLSLDDFRIIRDTIYEKTVKPPQTRSPIPYSVFMSPSLSRVGLTERDAKEQGYEYVVTKLDVATIPRAKILEQTDGLMKAIIDKNTNKILGCTLFCAQSSELINIISMAIQLNVDYTYIRDMIFTHPTMSEALNDLFTI